MQTTPIKNRLMGVKIIGVLIAISETILYYLYRPHVKAYFGRRWRRGQLLLNLSGFLISIPWELISSARNHAEN